MRAEDGERGVAVGVAGAPTYHIIFAEQSVFVPQTEEASLAINELVLPRRKPSLCDAGGAGTAELSRVRRQRFKPFKRFKRF